MDWMSLISGVVGAIIGGLLAGCFSLKATSKSHENQVKLAEDNEAQLVSGLLQAIHDEIETVFERYQNTMGVRLDTLEEGGAIAAYYPLSSDFFSVYNGNSIHIGRIKNNELRRQIVKTYTLAKSMVDSFRFNNELVFKLEIAHKLHNETQLEVHREQERAHFKSLVRYAKSLKEGHHSFKQEVTNLLIGLRNHAAPSD